MNERLREPLPEFPKSVVEPTFAHDDVSEELSTDKDSFSEKDEKVYIEPRVNGDEWALAQEAFFERWPVVDVPTERILYEQFADGRLTKESIKKNIDDAEVQYRTLAALLRRVPHTGLPYELPDIDVYFLWPQNEQDGFQTVLERTLMQSQHSVWLKEISGRFSALTELMQSYRHVADELGISFGDEDVDDEAMAAK